MENRLQRNQTAQQLRAYAASDVRRNESPVNWRFIAKEQDRCRNQLTLQTSDFWNIDWYGDWGQVIMSIILQVDGLLGKMIGTAHGEQVRVAADSSTLTATGRDRVLPISR